MVKLKVLFIANNNIGFGLSGGDTIFLKLLSHWKKQCSLTLLACQEAINILPKNSVSAKIIITDSVNPNPHNSISNLFLHYLRRIFKVFTTIHRHQDLNNHHVVYSVSDFLPDLLPAVYLKIHNPHIKWIAGYYLFAPPPWSKSSPYHGIRYFKGFVYWLIQKFTLPLVNRYADLVLITSAPDRSRFLPSKSVFVIQGGVDLPVIKKYLQTHPLPPVSHRKFDACFLGRFHPQKGVLELIDIWKIVTSTQPNAKLAIIGKGELEKQMHLKILKLKLSQNITLLGFRDGNSKYDIFRQSKIVVHPATYDSGGMAAAEAMAFGLPGISFDLESLKTYYPQGMIKTPCFDLKLFARNILNLLTDQNLYQKTSYQANNLILSKWSWEKKSTEILSTISTLSS